MQLAPPRAPKKVRRFSMGGGQHGKLATQAEYISKQKVIITNVAYLHTHHNLLLINIPHHYQHTP